MFQSRYQPMLQGVATNTFSQLVSVPPIYLPLARTACIVHGDFRLEIQKYDCKSDILSVQVCKLLDVLILLLTSQNTYRCAPSKINPDVSISLDDYLSICGKPPTKASKDELRKVTAKDLDLLCRIQIEWSEHKKDFLQHFQQRSLFDTAKISRGRIEARFSNEMAEYLVNSYITYYPISLLSIDNRKRAAYFAGKKLAYHYSLLQNQKKGSNNCISVSALLHSIPVIPDITSIEKSDPGHWDRRIHLPLENVMKNLIENRIMENWEYCLSGKKEVLDPDPFFASYENYCRLYIRFELCHYPKSSVRSSDNQS